MKTVTTSVGFQDALGNLILSGNLILTLSQAAEVTSGGGLIAPKVVVLALSATTAKIASTQIWFNDELTPTGTTYHAELLDSGGNIIADFGQWSITGASADLSTMVPVTSATVSLPGVVLTAPAAAQHITGTFDLTTPKLNGEIVVDGTQYAQTDVGIAAAIAACPDGGAIYLPTATYTITATSLPFTITKRITIRGGGWGTVLQIAAGVGATTDIFLLKPATASDVQGMRFQDFYITPASGTPGRNAFNIDGTNASVSNLIIDHVRVDGLGSYPLAVSNAAGLTNGTPYVTTIKSCYFAGGMNLTNSGDSITIKDSVFPNATTPTSKDIIISQIGAATSNGGAHGFTFIGNNVTLTGGIIIQNAWQGQMMFNDIEVTGNSTEANGAMLDIQGNASANVQGFTFAFNYFSGGTVGGISGPGIRIDRATGTRLIGNYLTGGVSPYVKTTANADRTDLLFNRLAPDNVIGTWLSDLGTNTHIDFVQQTTGARTIGIGTNGALGFSTIAGVTGVAITPAAVVANNANGILGFSSGDPTQTAADTVAWRGGADQWVFGNAFGDTSGIQIYRYHQLVENTAPAGVAGRDVVYGDSTTHELTVNSNNTGAAQIVSVKGKTSQKTESAADTNVLTFTPPALAGTYRINFALSLSAANTATLGWTATWTDSNGNAQAPTNLSLFQEGTAAPALTFTTSAAGNYYGSAIVDVNNAAVAIVVKLTFTGTSFTGKASATVERLI